MVTYRLAYLLHCRNGDVRSVVRFEGSEGGVRREALGMLAADSDVLDVAHVTAWRREGSHTVEVGCWPARAWILGLTGEVGA